MKKALYSIFMFAMLFCGLSLSSCSNDDALIDSNIATKSALLQITTVEPDTRAIKEGTTFAKGDTIGLVLTNFLRSDNLQMGACQELCYAVYDGKQWQLEKEFDLTGKGDMYVQAYYPYHHHGATGVEEGNGIHLTIRPYDVDYLTTEKPFVVSETNPKAELSFVHKMARVTVAINKNDGYKGVGKVTDVTLKGLRYENQITFVSGRATGDEPIVWPIDYTQSVNRSLASTIKVDFLVLPENMSKKTISVTFDDKAYEFRCPDVDAKAGERYTFTVGVGKNPPTIGEINGHEWVDLGLPSGLKWAACNVGAEHSNQWGTPFAWGEAATKEVFSIATSATHNRDNDWLTTNGYLENGSLTMKADAAREQWGGTWRMPTQAEMKELIDNCTWECNEHTSGIAGYTVKGKNGNSIFLPVTGYRYNKMNMRPGYEGWYWTSTPSKEATQANALMFDNEIHKVTGCNRYYGVYIRAVAETSDDNK